jgi:hypothetical protein
MALDFITKRINRSALRSVRERGSRVERFKLTSRKSIRETLLADEEIAKAVAYHVHESGLPN